MPLTRSSKIDPLYTVSQLLAHLQLGGHLKNLRVPDWATGGTSVEELIEALQTLGNGRWMQEDDEDLDTDVADSWILNFLKGQPVLSPDDID